MRLILAAVRTVVLISAGVFCASSDRTLFGQSSIAISAQQNVIGVKRIEIESSAWNGRKTIRQRLVLRATELNH
jgi:hypothetical protein